MNNREACSFTLDEALEKYKTFNNDLGRVAASIRSILANNKLTDEDYRVFSEFGEFNFLCICQIHLNDLPLSCIAVSMHSIFKDNLDDLCQLNIIKVDSDNCVKLLSLFGNSSYNQTYLFRGFGRLISFLNSMSQFSSFKENSIIEAQISSSKMSCIRKYFFNASKFLSRMSVCKNDKERIAMVRSEIRGVKLNCIRDARLSSEKDIEDYVNELTSVEDVLKHYCDDSLDADNYQPDADKRDRYNAPSYNADASEQVAKNVDHTAMRKIIAIYYLFSEISSNLFVDGNKKAIARFTSFLTGNNVDNIYGFYRNIFNEMDKDSPARRKDFEFVINELEKINLGEISDKIRKDMEG